MAIKEVVPHAYRLEEDALETFRFQPSIYGVHKPSALT
jgi:hypothetical protein